MGQPKAIEPELLRRGKEFHRLVQMAYGDDTEKLANRDIDWQKAKSDPPKNAPAFLRRSGKVRHCRFDVLHLIDGDDPISPTSEGQPAISFYELMEIKSTCFDGRPMENVRRIISRHRKQMMDYLGTLVDFGTPGIAVYPEGTVAPGIIYPSAPSDREVRQFIEDFFDENCISVVWGFSEPTPLSPSADP